MLSHISQSTYTPLEIEAIEHDACAPLSATPNLNRVSHSSIFINSFEPSLVVQNSKSGTDAFKEKKRSAKERKGDQNEAGSSYQRHVYVLKACKTCKAAHVGKEYIERRRSFPFTTLSSCMLLSSSPLQLVTLSVPANDAAGSAKKILVKTPNEKREADLR
jgi:hypothetical protein